MAKGAYIGVGGVARKIKKGYIGVYRDVEVNAKGLPSGYAELEYIENTGTQYINTGVVPTKQTKIEIEVSDWGSSEVSTTLFGAQKPSGSRYEVFINSSGKYRSYYFGAYKDFSGVSCVDKSTVIRDGVTTTINGVSVTNTEQYTNPNVPLFLLAHNSDGTATRIASAKLYSCKIYENGIRVRNYVPCTDSSR